MITKTTNSAGSPQVRTGGSTSSGVGEARRPTKPGTQDKPAQNHTTAFPSPTERVTLSREATEVEAIVLAGIQRGDTGVQGFLDRHPTEPNHVLLQGIVDWAAQVE